MNFIVDDDHKLIIIRPIGNLPAMEFVDNLFEAYARLEQPWGYCRVNDFRRWDGQLDPSATAEMALRWKAMTAEASYYAFVAVVTADMPERPRLPGLSTDHPEETVCHFTDYHEAVGWLLAKDRSEYLAGLGEMPQYLPDRSSLIID